MRIHLVDGTYELFRAHYGAPSRRSPDGIEVAAAVSLLASLAALLRQEEVTHVGVAFDHVIESFRNELFDGYKSSAGVPPELLAQFALAEEVAAALGLVIWPMVELEADDALASGAAKWSQEPAVKQVVLCSPDKDLAQCVRGSEVVCLDRRRRTVLDEERVRTKFGVAPQSIPDWLALVGDRADGLPGIPRWGAKSTSAVLAHYGHLDDIPDRVSDWDLDLRNRAALAEELAANRSRAELYLCLATLRTDADLGVEVADLAWKGARRTDIDALCRRLGYALPESRIERWQEQ